MKVDAVGLQTIEGVLENVHVVFQVSGEIVHDLGVVQNTQRLGVGIVDEFVRAFQRLGIDVQLLLGIFECFGQEIDRLIVFVLIFLNGRGGRLERFDLRLG